MLTRRRVPFGTADDNFLNGFNPSSNDADPHLDSRVRPASAKDCSRISVQDRTVEFLSVIKYAQARNPRHNSAPRGSQKLPPNEFQVISSKIGKDMSSTSEKLESLNLIISKKHDADSQEVANQLTEIIRQDLNMFNKQIAQLQQFLRHQMFNRQRMAHSNSVIVALQSKLVRMSTDFKVILELKQQNVRNSVGASSQQKTPGYQTSSWRDTSNNAYSNQTMPPRSQRHIPPSYPPPPPPQSLYQPPIQQTFNSYQPYSTQNDPAFYHNDDYGQQVASYQHNQALRQRYVQEDRSKDEMVEIEQTIVELGGIFQQLTTMVHEQGEMVQRIDSHIENTQLNIDLAHTELVKYFRSVASMRGLMLKVFAVLLIFIIFFFFFYL